MGYRILLIDHGSGAAERLGGALGQAGHDTLGVAGVVEALVLVESRSFDAVLIDEGGAEEAVTALCTRLSSLGHEKRSAVIVLADRVSRVVADPFERARRLGCDRIVDTAITAEELLALLGAMVGPAPPTPAEPARTEAIEDTNRDALSAESFRAGLGEPLLRDGGPAALAADDDRGGDIEAHLDSLFAAGRAATAAANRQAAPARTAGPRTSVSTEPRLPRVAPRPAAAPRVSAPPKPIPTPPPPAARTSPAPAQENIRRPPKALEQLRQPRLAVTPAAAPARRWPAVPPRIAVTAAVVLVVAGGIAGFAWLRPERNAGEAPATKPAEQQATAQLLPHPVHEAPAPEPSPPAAVPATDSTDSTASATPAPAEEPKLPTPPTLEEQPEKIDFGAPAIPMEPTVTHPAPPPTPKPKPAAASKPTVKPTPPPKPAPAPTVAVAAATPPPPTPKPAPSDAAPSQSRPAPVAAAVVDPGPTPATTPAPAPAPTAAAAPEVTHVPPAVLERVEPTYSPAALKKADGSAVIVLRVLVDEQGRISRVVVDQGLPGSELESAAISAVLRWRFQPATEGGSPVAGWTSARFEFKR